MNILVTAGNTQAPIDQVRCITNIFTGRTGASIALEAWRRGHRVVLVTSHPDIAVELASPLGTIPNPQFELTTYRTFDELHQLLEERIRGGRFDAICHAAAVSDYSAAGIYSPGGSTSFNDETGEIHGRFVNQSAGKVKSDAPELWLRLVRTPKIVDQFREPWGSAGTLVKFKLEVGKSDSELLAIAERSRLQSRADLMVANTLEGSAEWAFVGPDRGEYRRVTRAELPGRVLDLIEQSAIK